MAISFEKFQKRIRKNAKKGLYKKPPTIKPIKPDTALIRKESERITNNETIPSSLVAPILKVDSLITLNELLFESNSYTLIMEHFSALDSIGKFLLDHPTLEVKVQVIQITLETNVIT